MVLNAAWRCLVALGGAGGAWWCMAVLCVWFVLFGAAWRCLAPQGGDWWCLVVLGGAVCWFLLLGAAWRCLVVLGGAWRSSACGLCCLVRAF